MKLNKINFENFIEILDKEKHTGLCEYCNKTHLSDWNSFKKIWKIN